jgi:hypothetical protein
MLSRMKAWLKIGDLTGYGLYESPVVEAMNMYYSQMEEEALRRGEKGLPGYFELEETRQR